MLSVKKFISSFFVVLGFALILSACNKPKTSVNKPSVTPADRQKIGALFSINDLYSLSSSLPDADISYFSSNDEMVDALTKGDIDSFVSPDYSAKALLNGNESLTVSDKELGEFDLVFVYKKDNTQDYENKFSAWFEPMTESGYLRDMASKWIDGPEDERYIPTPTHSTQMADSSEMIKYAAVSDNYPISYMHNNGIEGISVDAAMRFCSGWGYSPEIISVKNMNSAVEMVKNGMADIAVYAVKTGEDIPSELAATDPFYTGSIVFVKMAKQ